jgi:hypothetical protein
MVDKTAHDGLVGLTKPPAAHILAGRAPRAGELSPVQRGC